ncbi:AEC family transporter [Pseudoruegeria sp. HB172150]|uniref:AEC family transporter n=1 Tax=Pseudoruegeria sp. HB172150 TaxID=2721164 RepID=UPI00155568F2|nr:AEC family transporter [Pseudoruegeria sp. HB172150]
MLQVLGITFPIFAIIGIGYVVTARGLFSPADMRTLGKYVLNIALPALLFSAVASRNLSEVIDPAYLTTILIGGLATIAVGYAAFSALGTGPARRAIAVLGMSLPNSAFIGYPVMLLLFPEDAGRILAMNFIAENFVFMPICLGLLELSRPQENRGPLRILGNILRQLLSRPFIIGLLLGLAVSLTGLPMPEPLTRMLGLLAASASALALAVIGGSLFGLPLKGNRALALQITAGKLILHPALVALAATLVVLLGFAPLAPDLRVAAILTAAMPMVSIYTILAQPYGHEGIAAIAVVTATTCAFVTLTALLAILV